LVERVERLKSFLLNRSERSERSEPKAIERTSNRAIEANEQSSDRSDRAIERANVDAKRSEPSRKSSGIQSAQKQTNMS
jgi:hypothetical protein